MPTSPRVHIYFATCAVKHYCPATRLFLVRVARRHADMVRASLTLIMFVQKQRARMSTVGVAGSARTARRALIERLEAGAAADGNTQRVEVVRHIKELKELQRQE